MNSCFSMKYSRRDLPSRFSCCCRRRQQQEEWLLCLPLWTLEVMTSRLSWRSCEALVAREWLTGMQEIPEIMPLTATTGLAWQKECSLIFGMGSLISGTTLSTLLRRDLRLSLQKLGNTQFPSLIFLYSSGVSESSKGRYPQHMAYSTIPQLQISVIMPLYGCPDNISGAAQLGLPQAVFSFSFWAQMLPNPKSTTLMLLCLSSSRFSGLRSLWVIPKECKYSTALRIC